jgi:kinesin family protein 6/9
LLIEKLKKEVARLKAELELLKGGNIDEELPDYEIERVHKDVDLYIETNQELVYGDARKISEAFKYFRELVLNGSGGRAGVAPTSTAMVSGNPSRDADIDKLRRLIAHRDNEINILVGLINQYKKKYGELPKEGKLELHNFGASQSSIATTAYVSSSGQGRSPVPMSMSYSSPSPLPQQTSLQASQDLGQAPPSKMPLQPPVLPQDKVAAFDKFRATYAQSAWIEEHKATLKSKYAEAKALGEEAGRLRSEIKELKAALDDGAAGDEARAGVADKVAQYKAQYGRLKDLKKEIEHLQHLLEQARVRMTKEFERWYLDAFVRGERPASGLARSLPSVASLASGGSSATLAGSRAGSGSAELGPGVEDDIKAFYRAREQLLQRRVLD